MPPIKPNIGTKTDFVARPSIPTSQKEAATEFNQIVSAIRANYERLILNWDTDILINVTLPVGQYILFSGDVYIVNTSYSVGNPITWNAGNATIIVQGFIDHFKGIHVDLTALNTAHPTADEGDYAFVDAGIGNAPNLYIWDESDTEWVIGGSAPIAFSSASEINTGTEAAKAIAPNQLEASKYITQSLAKIFAVASGTNTYTASLTPAIAAYGTGQLFVIQFTNPSTSTTPTLNVNALGAKTIVKRNTSALVTGDIAAGQIYILVYDGTNMRILGTANTGVFNDIILSNQVASGSDQRPLWIDSTGKIQKSAFVNFAESVKKVTQTGSDDGASTVQHEWLNNSLAQIMAIFNDQHVEIGGGTSVISILSGVASGAAYIEINSNQSEAFKVLDKVSNTFVTYNSTTGALAIRTHQKIINEQGLGFEKVTLQAFITTSGAAGATNLITFVNLATNMAIDLTVNHLFAYEQDNGDVVVANGGRKGVAKNVGGTVSGAFDSFSVLCPGGTTALWSLVADDTNKRININFINTTGAGKIFDIALDFSYILRPLPTS